MRIPHLNRTTIKYIVAAAMLSDHIAWAFVPTRSAAGIIMHFIGRLAGPTMAFFLAEGYLHTKNKKKYAARLGLFALISWVPFSLFETLRWPTAHFGVIYTLFLGFLAAWAWEELPGGNRVKGLAVTILCGLSVFGDWPVFDVLWPLFLVIYKDDKKARLTSFAIIYIFAYLYAVVVSRMWQAAIYNLGLFVVAAVAAFVYDGSPGSRRPFHKWFFYVFYPAHLAVLAAILIHIYR